MNGMNELIERGAVYTRTNIYKTSLPGPKNHEGQRKVVIYFQYFLIPDNNGKN